MVVLLVQQVEEVLVQRVLVMLVVGQLVDRVVQVELDYNLVYLDPQHIMLVAVVELVITAVLLLEQVVLVVVAADRT
jgi:hypothetical protein